MTSKYILVIAIAICSLAFVVGLPKVAPVPAPVPVARSAAVIKEDPKQLLSFLGTRRETSTADFVRLVVMRIIYGIASTMGLEERLAEVFNGAFVPPGEEDGDFGLDFGGIDGIFDER